MATFESIATTNFPGADTTSVVITKPTGLAVGDLMIAFLGKGDAINPGTSDIQTASGWTARGNIKNGDGELNVQSKVADSADVAASNFTFTADEACSLGGALMRVSGFGRWEGVEFDFDGGGTTISYTSAQTPLLANSLVVTAFFGLSGSATSYSAYTSTPSITFTERADFNNTSASDGPSMAVATGVYSGTSQITAYGRTSSVAHIDSGCIIVITPATSPTVDISHLAIIPTVESVTASQVNVSTDVGHTAITPTLNGIETDNSSDRTQWVNEESTTTTWTNETL